MVEVSQMLPFASAAIWCRSAEPVGLPIAFQDEPFQRCTGPRPGAAQTLPAGSIASDSMESDGRCAIHCWPSHSPTPWLVGETQTVPSAAWTEEVEESVWNGQGAVPQLFGL